MKGLISCSVRPRTKLDGTNYSNIAKFLGRLVSQEAQSNELETGCSAHSIHSLKRHLAHILVSLDQGQCLWNNVIPLYTLSHARVAAREELVGDGPKGME